MVRKSGALIVLAIALVGCSSSSKTTVSTTTVSLPKVGSVLPETGNTTVPQTLDPCKLMTAADASKLAGTPVTHASGGGVGSLLCVYKAGTKAGAQITVKVDADAAAAHAEFPTWVQPFKGNPVGLTITSIPSLGSEANKTLNGTVNAGIYVRKGATLVKIGVYPPAKNAALRAAVTAALGRL